MPKKRGINWGFADKSFWEWLLLLGTLLAALGAIAIPIVIAIETTRFSEQQHQTDLQIAEDQQRAAILQTYIDNIQDLLLNHKLLQPKPNDAVATLARARTLTALRGLDSKRKGYLIQFLYGGKLINIYVPSSSTGFSFKKVNPIISLYDAPLIGADLSGAGLFGVDLDSADLSGANLSFVDLGSADLSQADLSGANLQDAINLFGGVDLSGANLRGADLRGASFQAAILVSANLSGANLSGTNLSLDDLSDAHLKNAIGEGAFLADVKLNSADLSSAKLSKAILGFSNLSGADLRGTDLSGADLRGATVTREQLAQAKSLKGATMPDGSIHP